jgi:ribonuclease Z
MEVWRKEREQRIAHEKRPSVSGLEINVVELEPEQVLQFNDVRCQVIEVDHHPVKDAFGFSFEADGTKAVFSGDTTYSPVLIDAARGADVLVHEVFIHNEMTVLSGGNRSPEGSRNVAGYHTLSDVVGKVANEADVGALILTHFVPPRFDRGRLLAQVQADYPGPVIIGEDLLEYDTVSRQISYRGLVLALPEQA